MTTPEDTLRQAAETAWDDFYARMADCPEGEGLTDEEAFFKAVEPIKTFRAFTVASVGMIAKLGSPERGGVTKDELLDTLHRMFSIASFIGWKTAQAQQEAAQLELLFCEVPNTQPPETDFNIT